MTIYISKVFWKTASKKGKHMYITSLLSLRGGKRKLGNENSYTIVYVSQLYSMVKQTIKHKQKNITDHAFNNKEKKIKVVTHIIT